MPLNPLIPEHREDAVVKAFRDAFGRPPPLSLHPLKGGVSGALILRGEIDGRAYVLRVEPERIAVPHRVRGFDCLQSAAGVGAAPRVYYTNAADGVAVMDFVPPQPLAGLSADPFVLAAALGALIGTVQTAPLFASLGPYPEVIGSLLTVLIVKSKGRLGNLSQHQDALARLAAALSCAPQEAVSSHNDPNPRNIIYDGERLWLVDWELASANDPLVDVAILATEQVAAPELEIALMTAVFGTPPNRQRLARLHAIRLLTRLFYGCIVLESLGGGPPAGCDIQAPALTPPGFRMAVAEGRLASGSAETAFAFGRMSLAAFAAETNGPRFEEILQILNQG